MLSDRRLIWSPRARADLDDIWRYYAGEASETIANQVYGEIAHAVQRLLRETLPGRDRSALRPGVRSILAPPYAIFFAFKKDEVRVVRILHQRRDLVALFKPRQRERS